jgi:hypothetical protein
MNSPGRYRIESIDLLRPGTGTTVMLIHLFALLVLLVTAGDWKIMILDVRVFTSSIYTGYGYPLWVAYLIWIGVVLLLYPLSKKYINYKANNKEKWWLSYL